MLFWSCTKQEGPVTRSLPWRVGVGKKEASWSQGQRLNVLSWRAHCKSPWVTPWEVAISYSVLTTSLSQLPFFLLALALTLLPQESSLYSWTSFLLCAPVNPDILQRRLLDSIIIDPSISLLEWKLNRHGTVSLVFTALSFLILCQAHCKCLRFILLWARITEPNGYPHPIMSEYSDTWKVPKYFCTLDPVMKSPPPSL